MKGSRIESRDVTRRDSGFSLTELVVAMVVGLILMAVAMPAFLRAYHSYQLNDAATQLCDILRLTRYEAIRLNRQMNCVIQPDSINPAMTRASLTDASGNAQNGVGGRAILLGPNGNLVDTGTVPGAGTLPAKANLGPTAPVAIPPAGAILRFDARGALTSGNVNVFYLASSNAPDTGFRAVLLSPAGSLQVWTDDGTGNWHQLR